MPWGRSPDPLLGPAGFPTRRNGAARQRGEEEDGSGEVPPEYAAALEAMKSWGNLKLESPAASGQQKPEGCLLQLNAGSQSRAGRGLLPTTRPQEEAALQRLLPDHVLGPLMAKFRSLQFQRAPAPERWRGRMLEYAAMKLMADRTHVLASVAKNGLALGHARPELLGDRELVLTAVRQHGGALAFAAPRLRDDRAVALAAVAQSGDALAHVGQRLRADRQVVLAAVRQHGRALQHAALELRTDRDIVIAAVNDDPCAVSYAAPTLHDDCEVVALAVQDRVKSEPQRGTNRSPPVLHGNDDYGSDEEDDGIWP